MVQISLRRLALAGTLAALALTAMAGSAHAAVTASTITSPAANSYFFYDNNAASSTLFTVTGTTTGTGNVDIDCYDGYGDVDTLVANVTVTGNAFSTQVTTSEITTAEDSTPLGATGVACVLRAVDTGDATDYSPGSSTSFSGPAIAFTQKTADTSAGGTYNFDYFLNDFSGYMDIESAGYCGLSFANPYTATFGGASDEYCLGGLYDTYQSETSSTVGPEITVDGTEALDADEADDTLSGYQGISLSESFNSSTGALTIHDDEPLMLCTPNCASATSYTSAGVELDRTWQTADDGLLAMQTDVFQSTNGAQHTLAVEEDDAVFPFSPPTGASFDFPGSTGFQDYSDTSTVTLPSGPGAIYFKTNSTTPDAGDGTSPQGAIIYSTPTTTPIAFTYSDEASSGDADEWVMPYTRTIPAGGSATLRFAYAQAYSLTQVQALAASALASFSPVVSITSPANGTTVSTPAVAVSGTVSDAVGVASVKVNGVTAVLGTGGTFTAPVALTPGANTITAVATNTDGITATAQISVTYHNPPVVTTGKASKISSSSAKVAGTVNPEGQATAYEVQYGKTTSYGSATTAASAGSGSAAVAVTSTLNGLKAATTYHYRVIATNASGPSYGTDATFKTAKPSPKGLGAKVSPKTATSFPYHYKVKGKLSRPSGVSAKQGCSGKITVKVKRGSKTISTSHAKITKKCTWSVKVTLSKHSKVPGTGKLKITPSFGGNGALAALTAKALTVHYG